MYAEAQESRRSLALKSGGDDGGDMGESWRETFGVYKEGQPARLKSQINI